MEERLPSEGEEERGGGERELEEDADWDGSPAATLNFQRYSHLLLPPRMSYLNSYDAFTIGESRWSGPEALDDNNNDNDDKDEQQQQQQQQQLQQLPLFDRPTVYIRYLSTGGHQQAENEDEEDEEEEEGEYEDEYEVEQHQVDGEEVEYDGEDGEDEEEDEFYYDGDGEIGYYVEDEEIDGEEEYLYGEEDEDDEYAYEHEYEYDEDDPDYYEYGEDDYEYDEEEDDEEEEEEDDELDDDGDGDEHLLEETIVFCDNFEDNISTPTLSLTGSRSSNSNNSNNSSNSMINNSVNILNQFTSLSLLNSNHPMQCKYGLTGYFILNKLKIASIAGIEINCAPTKFLTQIVTYYTTMAEKTTYQASQQLVHFIQFLPSTTETSKLINSNMQLKESIPLKIVLDILEHYYRTIDTPVFTTYQDIILPMVSSFYRRISNDNLLTINRHFKMILDKDEQFGQLIPLLENQNQYLNMYNERLKSIRNLCGNNNNYTYFL